MTDIQEIYNTIYVGGFILYDLYIYSLTPEIEIANLSQSHVGLNLSHIRAYCLFHRSSSTATKNNCNMRLMLEIN